MNDKSAPPPAIVQKARALVAAGQAATFREACTILARHAATVRTARRDRRRRASEMWWTKQ